MGRDGGRAGSGGTASSREAARARARAEAAREKQARQEALAETREAQAKADPSRAQQATQTRAQSQRAGAYGQLDASSSMGDVTNGAIANFTDAMDATPDPRAGFAGHVDGQAMSMSDITSEAQQNIQANAEPGLLGRLASFGAGFANPLAGLAVDTMARGYDASRDAKAHNERFGTTVETGLASNTGRQALGAVGGFAGSRALGHIGSRMGSSFGPVGLIAGTMLGSTVGKSVGRDLAMGNIDIGTPGGYTGGEGIDASREGGGGNYEPNRNTMVASAPTTTTPSGNTRPDFGPTNFNGYASYAQSFFA